MGYRVVVGEQGNDQGHVVDVVGDEAYAYTVLDREVAKYQGDGWGRVEVRRPGGWERLDQVCEGRR